MQILIQSPHVTPTEELTKFIKNKIGKLSHFYDRIEAAEVFLKIEKSDSTDDKVCEIRLAIPGNDLFGKKQSDTFEDAVTKVIDVLHGEIDKMKTRFQHQQ
ncbi:MAG: ribosome-associated translation inhibitor RaiA [Ginsengibacter sp.]